MNRDDMDTVRGQVRMAYRLAAQYRGELMYVYPGSTVTEDARVASASLDALADLAEGWADGESGEPITDAVIERGRALFEAMIAASNITQTVSPTEEGGVTFFWPEAENQLSIEIEPSGALYIHTTDLLVGTFSDEKIGSDVDDLADALDQWLSAGGLAPAAWAPAGRSSP